MRTSFYPMEQKASQKVFQCAHCSFAIERGAVYNRQAGIHEGARFANSFHPECWNALGDEDRTVNFRPGEGQPPKGARSMQEAHDTRDAPLTAERLKQVLHYDPETGYFTWLLSPTRGINPGDRTSDQPNPRGYFLIKVDRRSYKAHRLAWLYMTGAWPVALIDHINGVRSDNRFCNLREATLSQNQANSKRSRLNKTGFKGVSFHESYGLYSAQVTNPAKGRVQWLGYFKSAEEAHAAYCRAAVAHYGEFANGGNGPLVVGASQENYA